MLHQIGIPLRRRWREYVPYLAAGLAFFAGGLLLDVAILHIEEPEVWAPLAFLMTGVALLFIAVWDGILAFSMYYRLAVHMGGSRKAFLIGYVLERLVCIGGQVGVLLLLLYLAEVPVCRMVRDVPLAFVDVYGGWTAYCPLLLLVFVLLVVFTSMLAELWGAKARVLLWVVWMLAAVGLPQLMKAAGDYPESVAGKLGNLLLQFFTGLANGQGLALAAVGMAALALGIRLLAGRLLKKDL